MRVTVRFFAGTREAVGAPSRTLEVASGARVADLLAALTADHPRLSPYRPHALVAVNGAFVPESHALAGGDVVAIMPPVSGGSVSLGSEAPSLDALAARLARAGAGAVVAFLGIVRPTSGERPDARVVALSFEAYVEMAEAALAELREAAIAKFGLVDCAIHHRLGRLDVGEPVVAVATSGRHRREAFDAAQWLMDELKTRVPVWKAEIDADGTRTWVNDPTREVAP